MEFLPKDVYEYLTQFGEDEDILNMLKVNKNFNKIINDNFFERVIRRKYPLLIKFKVDDQTWKDFYLSMVKYISKLEEEFGIPYIPNKDYNPKDFYNHYNKDRYIYNKAMDLAALGGHMEIVKLMKKWLALAESGPGERGIMNRSGLKTMLPKRRV